MLNRLRAKSLRPTVKASRSLWYVWMIAHRVCLRPASYFSTIFQNPVALRILGNTACWFSSYCSQPLQSMRTISGMCPGAPGREPRLYWPRSLGLKTLSLRLLRKQPGSPPGRSKEEGGQPSRPPVLSPRQGLEPTRRWTPAALTPPMVTGPKSWLTLCSRS